MNSTNNLWEIFALADILNIVRAHGPVVQAIINQINVEMNHTAAALEIYGHHDPLRNVDIRLTSVNATGGGLVVEFQYIDHLNNRKRVHATFHNDPAAGASPSHIQYDGPYGSPLSIALNNLGINRWADLQILYTLHPGTWDVTGIEIRPAGGVDLQDFIIGRLDRASLRAQGFVVGQLDIDIMRIILAGLSELFFQLLYRIRPILAAEGTVMDPPPGGRVNTNMDGQLFHEKYLKYKQKYLELKKSLQNMNIN